MNRKQKSLALAVAAGGAVTAGGAFAMHRLRGQLYSSAIGRACKVANACTGLNVGSNAAATPLAKDKWPAQCSDELSPGCEGFASFFRVVDTDAWDRYRIAAIFGDILAFFGAGLALPKIVYRSNCGDCEDVMGRTTFFAVSAVFPPAVGIFTSISQTYPSEYELAKEELNNSRSDSDDKIKIDKIIDEMDGYKRSEHELLSAYYIPLVYAVYAILLNLYSLDKCPNQDCTTLEGNQDNSSREMSRRSLGGGPRSDVDMTAQSRPDQGQAMSGMERVFVGPEEGADNSSGSQVRRLSNSSLSSGRGYNADNSSGSQVSRLSGPSSPRRAYSV